MHAAPLPPPSGEVPAEQAGGEGTLLVKNRRFLRALPKGEPLQA